MGEAGEVRFQDRGSLGPRNSSLQLSCNTELKVSDKVSTYLHFHSPSEGTEKAKLTISQKYQ